MTLFDTVTPSARTPSASTPLAEIDQALTAQLLVAWAGESGEDKRLGWWRSDLVSEFGGEDLFRRVLPRTWQWAVLQGAREAARLRDAELRGQDHDADRILSLFSLGFEVEERIEERLQDLKRAGDPPAQALPGLALITPSWNQPAFLAWVTSHGEPNTTTTTIGRRLKGTPPPSLAQQVRELVAALAPTAEAYPLPHYRKS